MTLLLLVTNENPCYGKLTCVCLIKEPGRCNVTLKASHKSLLTGGELCAHKRGCHQLKKKGCI